MTRAAALAGRSRPAVARPRSSRRDDLITVLLGAWLMTGLVVDAWAHNTNRPETFFTPWHGGIYSGFLASAAWIGSVLARQVRSGRSGLGAVPVGYGLAVVGVATFGVGGVADLAWHTVFGIEADVEALLSPSHLLLFLGSLLLLSTALRAGWASTGPDAAEPSVGDFLPVLLSATLAGIQVHFITMYVSAFADTTVEVDSARIAEPALVTGIAGILASNLLLMATLLLLIWRWRVPFGSIAFLFTCTAVALTGTEGFQPGSYVVAAALAGLAGDGLYRVLQPGPLRPGALRLFAFALPLVQWGLYLAAARLDFGMRWSADLAAGVVALSGLAGIGLSLLLAPPPAPHQPAAALPQEEDA